MKNLLKLASLALLPVLFLLISCEIPTNTPQSGRIDITIQVKDSSLFTTTFQDSPFVAGADVFLYSLSYGTRLEQQTDEDGNAVFTGLVPDNYSIAVHKEIPDSVVELVTGAKVKRVLNGQVSEVEFTADGVNYPVWVLPASIGSLLISEIYYNGALPNPPYYYHDQFTEIYNNSDSTIYLDSVIVADASYGYTEEDVIHSVHAYMFPGSGKDHPLAPGEMIIIAQDAINHSAINPNSIDLTGAQFEYYVSGTGDVDNKDVPNMIQLHHKYGNDFLYSVMNDAICILKTRDPYARGYDDFDCILLPKADILDGVEYRESLSETDLKHLDPSIDAGLTGGMQMYKGKSVARFVESVNDSGHYVLRDNNNSSIDFRVLDTPTPGEINP